MKVGIMDTKNVTAMVENIEYSNNIDDSFIVDGMLDSKLKSGAHSNTISKFLTDPSRELNLPTSQDRIVKKEPIEIHEDPKVMETSSETDRGSDCLSYDFLTNNASDDKTEITEIVLMNSKDSTTVKIADQINSLSERVCSSINESEETCSVPHLSSYQLFLGPWKNHSIEKGSPDNGEVWFKCLKCEFYTSSGTFLKEHYKNTHLAELFTCQDCSIMFISKKNLSKHIRIHHQLNKQWKCLRCNFSTKQYSNLTRHRKRHAKPLQCVECDNNFSSRRQLQCHMLKCHAEKADSSYIHRCHICSSTYALRSSFEKHMHKHFGIRPYSCNYCDYKSTIKKNIVRHEMTRHFFPTKLRCPYCSKKFYDQQSFDEHKITHLVHQCHLCSFKESSWRNLIKHCNSVHGKEAMKPLQCKMCLRRFSYKSSLKNHCKRICQKRKQEKIRKRNNNEKTCSNLKVYQCHACNEQFTKYKVLRRHLEFCVFKS